MKWSATCLLFLVIISAAGQERTFRIGNDIGLTSFDIRDEALNASKFEQTTFSLVSVGGYRIKNNHILFGRFSYNRSKLRRGVERDSDTDFTDLYNYELNLEYYRKVKAIGSKASLYAGVGYNGRFFFMEQFYTGFFVGNRDSYELVPFNFSFNPMLYISREKNDILIKGGLSLFSYTSRPDDQFVKGFRKDTLDYFTSSIGDLTDFHISISTIYTLGERFEMKPEYVMRYYNYKSEGLEFLKQSWLLGLYYRL